MNLTLDSSGKESNYIKTASVLKLIGADCKVLIRESTKVSISIVFLVECAFSRRLVNF